MKKKVQSHTLEKIIATLMAFFGISAVYIMVQALKVGKPDPIVAILEILIIIIVAIFAQTYVIIKLYEQLQKIEEKMNK